MGLEVVVEEIAAGEIVETVDVAGAGERPRGRKDEEEKWVPCTKLGRLVQQVHPLSDDACGSSRTTNQTLSFADKCGLQGKIKSLEQIYLFSMPVKEYQIVENFLGPSLKDEVMKIMPVQKQTRAGQRTRFKVRPEC